MATSKNAGLNKEALVEEIKKRRAAGRSISVDLRATEDVLRAALDADEMDNGDFTPEAKTPTPPAPPAKKLDPTVAPAGAEELTPEQLRLGAAARADGVHDREIPADLNEYSGQYRYLQTGEIFGLKIEDVNNVRGGKTHRAKSPLKFWDGTPEEFRAQFEKV